MLRFIITLLILSVFYFMEYSGEKLTIRSFMLLSSILGCIAGIILLLIGIDENILSAIYWISLTLAIIDLAFGWLIELLIEGLFELFRELSK